MCPQERLGYDWSTALSIGSACAGKFARVKGTSLGLYKPGEGDAPADEVRRPPVPASRITLSVPRDASIRTSESFRHRQRTFDVPQVVSLLGEGAVPAIRGPHGLRGLNLRTRGSSETWELVEPTIVYRSLASAFGDGFGDLYSAFSECALCPSRPPSVTCAPKPRPPSQGSWQPHDRGAPRPPQRAGLRPVHSFPPLRSASPLQAAMRYV